MSPEIKLAFSREVPKGSCVIGREVEGKTAYTPVAISDSMSTDIFVCGIARKIIDDGENPVIVFHDEEEMEENEERIRRAFEDLVKDE